MIFFFFCCCSKLTLFLSLAFLSSEKGSIFFQWFKLEISGSSGLLSFLVLKTNLDVDSTNFIYFKYSPFSNPLFKWFIFCFDHCNSHLISLSVSPLTPSITPAVYPKQTCWCETVITLLPYLELCSSSLWPRFSVLTSGMVLLLLCFGHKTLALSELGKPSSRAGTISFFHEFLASKTMPCQTKEWTSIVIYVIYGSCLLTFIFINMSFVGSFVL